MASIGESHENGDTEQLMHNLEEKEMDLSYYDNFADAMQCIGQFIEDVYMVKYIHHWDTLHHKSLRIVDVSNNLFAKKLYFVYSSAMDLLVANGRIKILYA
ncbi:MAG: hypothetical protein AAFQ07_14055 [Chloroflexota bacterium]